MHGKLDLISLDSLVKKLCQLLLVVLMMATGTPSWSQPTRSEVQPPTQKSESAALPTIVLQSGIGDGKAAWAFVTGALAPNRSVIAIDRPGYGDAPPIDGPRDPCSIAAELRQELKASGSLPPYILVGHSLGGLYQYVYARLYPADVAGLVLVDPTHPDHWREVQKTSPAAAGMISGMRDLFSPTLRREFDEHTACLDRIDQTQPLAMPTTLLVRSVFRFVEWGPFEDMTHRLEDGWQKLTGAKNFHRVERAGHYIQRDRPDAVVRAIEQVTNVAGTLSSAPDVLPNLVPNLGPNVGPENAPATREAPKVPLRTIPNLIP